MIPIGDHQSATIAQERHTFEAPMGANVALVQQTGGLNVRYTADGSEPDDHPGFLLVMGELRTVAAPMGVLRVANFSPGEAVVNVQWHQD